MTGISHSDLLRLNAIICAAVALERDLLAAILLDRCLAMLPLVNHRGECDE